MKKGNSIKEKILMAIFYIVIAILVVAGIALICCTIWANIHYAKRAGRRNSRLGYVAFVLRGRV